MAPKSTEYEDTVVGPSKAAGPPREPSRPLTTNGQDADDDEEDDDEEDVGPKPPSPIVGEKRKANGEADGEGGESDEDEGFEDDDEDDGEQLPISHEIVLKDHTKVRIVLEIR